MPIYEYKCHKCGKLTEVMQKFSDQPLTKCPSCTGKISRLISNCAFHLKGTGWYVTDYKKKDSGWRDKAPELAKSEAKAETKTETKTESAAAKTEEKS